MIQTGDKGIVDTDTLAYLCDRRRVSAELTDRRLLADAARICRQAFGMDREDLRGFRIEEFLRDLKDARISSGGKTRYRVDAIGSYTVYSRPYNFRFLG